ncbi:hypothetical protein GCM10027570_27090 [Streptomonospora sediminis]
MVGVAAAGEVEDAAGQFDDVGIGFGSGRGGASGVCIAHAHQPNAVTASGAGARAGAAGPQTALGGVTLSDIARFLQFVPCILRCADLRRATLRNSGATG